LSDDFGKVAVLMGGDSNERAVSLLSGEAVLHALKRLGINAEAFDPSSRDINEIQSYNRAFIALHGDLGAGKTTLVRHLLHALGVTGRVKSPTYAVVEPYDLPSMAIWHFDFYRFNDPREWEDAGFRDIFSGPGLKLAEWPEKAASVLPAIDLDIFIRTDADTHRQVSLVANTPTGADLLHFLSEETP
jgi:tRNA threonylcarbamoyladenosine biosynthesis protein TsaE